MAPATKLDVNGTITCTGFNNTSDESVKEHVALADLEEVQRIFEAIEVKTYTRNDIEEESSRIGFIAQDFDNSIDKTSLFQNIVSPIVREGEPELLGIDYSRIVTLLWGVCKRQEARIKALETKKSRSSK